MKYYNKPITAQLKHDSNHWHEHYEKLTRLPIDLNKTRIAGMLEFKFSRSFSVIRK